MRNKEVIYAALGLSAIVALGGIAQPAVAHEPCQANDDFYSATDFHDTQDIMKLRREKSGTIYLRGISAVTRENVLGDIDEACPRKEYIVNYSIKTGHSPYDGMSPWYTATGVCKPR